MVATAAGHKPSKYSHAQWIEIVVHGWSKDLAPELPPPGGCWRSLLKRHPGKAGTAPYVDEVRAWLEGDERLKHLAFWDSTTKLGLPRKESADWKAFLRETVVPRFNGGTPDAEAIHALDQLLTTEDDICEFIDLLDAASTPEGDETRSRKRRHDETGLPFAAQPEVQVALDLVGAPAVVTSHTLGSVHAPPWHSEAAAPRCAAELVAAVLEQEGGPGGDGSGSDFFRPPRADKAELCNTWNAQLQSCQGKGFGGGGPGGGGSGGGEPGGGGSGGGGSGGGFNFFGGCGLGGGGLPFAAQVQAQVQAHLQAAAATTGGVEDGEEAARPRVVEGEALPVVATPVGFVSQYLKMLSTLQGMIETHLETAAGLPADEQCDLQAQADELGTRLAAHGEGKFSHYRGELALSAPRPGSLAARVSRILARMSDEDERSTSPPALAPTSGKAAAPTYRTLRL